jgi:phage terminase Nu1 subunit (DNA packaging protein)
MMKTEVASRELAKLLALKSPEITDLVKREIIVSGSKRGSYKLQESIRNYVEHLRKLATAPVSEDAIKQATIERTKPVAAQADLAKTKAEQMRVDMVPALGLEKLGMPRAHVRLMTKRVRSFQIYIRDGRYHTVWGK